MIVESFSNARTHKGRVVPSVKTQVGHHRYSRLNRTTSEPAIEPVGRVYGYAKASAYDQKEALRNAGCKTVRSDLDILIDDLRRGDTLVVTRLCNLAPSIKEAGELVRGLNAKGVTLRATEQPIDTSASNSILDLFEVFAEFVVVAPKERPLGRR